MKFLGNGKNIWVTPSNIISIITELATVPISRHTVSCFMYIFANMVWFWLMHVLYSKQIDKTKYLH